MSADKRRVLLGHISHAHGIRGEVVLKSYTADPEAIAGYGPLEDDTGGRVFKILSIRESGKGLIARIEGVADRNQAEALRGTDLYIDRAKLPAPDEGEFYYADLIGLSVVDASGKIVGRVVAVQDFGAGDLLEVRLAGQQRTEFVPFNDACVPEVDFEKGRVVISPLSGLSNSERAQS
jgi:16S rRNA processing protein RimM